MTAVGIFVLIYIPLSYPIMFVCYTLDDVSDLSGVYLNLELLERESYLMFAPIGLLAYTAEKVSEWTLREERAKQQADLEAIGKSFKTLGMVMSEMNDAKRERDEKAERDSK